MHYDLGMDLYDKRHERGVLVRDYRDDMRAGGMGVVGAAIYLEDRYLPEMALRVALGQIARIVEETREPEAALDFALCRSHAELEAAGAARKIALVLTMEGVEPIGTDLNLLRIFHELGVRMIGLTHVRRNMAGDGGVFAREGSSRHGLTAFGKDVVRTCEALGIMVDLAHINPAGFDDMLSIATKPLSVSHSNARKHFNIERNMTDDQIRAVGACGGVIGVNAVLVSPDKTSTTIDRYVDHVEHIVALAGIDAVGIGFDFFERIFNRLPAAERAVLGHIHFVPDLNNHSQARNVTRRLIERGWADVDIAKFLFGNWRRLLRAIVA
jgi:membrane dipeptidase